MAWSYTPLLKLLSERKMNRSALRQKGITAHALARIGRNETVTMDVLARLCNEFRCGISDIVEYVPDSTGTDNDGESDI